VVVVEAIQRLFNPVPLIAGPVAWAAVAGIAINFGSARLFSHDHQLGRDGLLALARQQLGALGIRKCTLQMEAEDPP
jgi:hypothetical protein